MNAAAAFVIMLIVAVGLVLIFLDVVIDGPKQQRAARQSAAKRRERERQASDASASTAAAVTIAELQALVAVCHSRIVELESNLAEAQAALAETLSTKDTGHQFARLKKLVVRELHPDGRPDAGVIERTVRSELFKRLWPEIEKIEGASARKPMENV